MGRQTRRAEQHQIINHHLITGLQEFRDKDATFVSGAAGDEYFFHKIIRVSVGIERAVSREN